MRIWLVQTGEEMPSDGPGTRLLRTALLAGELSRRGHDVVYWNATFNHQKKVQRASASFVQSQSDGYETVFLYGRSYASNVSLGRILSHRENAAEFAKIAPAKPRPDLIVCGMPTIELCHAVAQFAQASDVPYVIDCRDMWPEVIEDRLPMPLRLATYPVTQYWRRQRNTAFANAAAVTGVTDAFVAWGKQAGGGVVGVNDRFFVLTADTANYSEADLAAAEHRWVTELGPRDPNRTTILMAGNLSDRVDIMTAVRAAASMASEGSKSYQLVVCGKGDLERAIAEIAADSATVHFAGWCSGAEIRQLADRCAAGLLPYSNVADLLASLPNKVGEYLSYGLPILTCLKGEVAKALGPRNVIVPYTEGDEESFKAAVQCLAWPVPESMRQATRAAFEDLFDPKMVYPAFADHLENMVRCERRTVEA
jgi:glycosyltransferase involved in cell wall biosynthesis